MDIYIAYFKSVECLLRKLTTSWAYMFDLFWYEFMSLVTSCIVDN